MKAALRFVGVEYPKQHDVSAALTNVKDRFPKWFGAETLAERAIWLAERREPAMYGDEGEGVPADELFTREDARKALSYAEGIYKACVHLIKKR